MTGITTIGLFLEYTMEAARAASHVGIDAAYKHFDLSWSNNGKFAPQAMAHFGSWESDDIR